MRLNTKTLPVALALLLALSLSASAQTLQNFAAIGPSFCPACDQRLAATGLYARPLVEKIGFYSFTVVDAVPTSTRPIEVTLNFSSGVAQRLTTIRGVGLYVPLAAGYSQTGESKGWSWTTGGLASIKLKGSCYLMPNARVVKSSVTNNSGYQFIAGVLFGTGW